MMENVVLICKRVRYFSQLGEAAFFEWVKKIKSIVKYDAVYDELYLYVKSKNIPDADLRELLAIFYIYKINMKQLAVFLNKKNKRWLMGGKKGERSYYYYRIFEKKMNLREATPMLRSFILDKDDKSLAEIIKKLKNLGYKERSINNKIAEIKNLIKRKGDIPSFFWSRDGKGPE